MVVKQRVFPVVRSESHCQNSLMSAPTSSAVRALALEYKSLQEEPVEGFRVKLLNEDNLFEWEVAIFGPPDTLYQGGYFKVSLFLFFFFFWLEALRVTLEFSTLRIRKSQMAFFLTVCPLPKRTTKQH